MLPYHIYYTTDSVSFVMMEKKRNKKYHLRWGILMLLILFTMPSIYAQHPRMTTKEYINKYKDIAIKDMKAYKIPASITLAQGILESGSGNSKLARKATYGLTWQGHE